MHIYHKTVWRKEEKGRTRGNGSTNTRFAKAYKVATERNKTICNVTIKQNVMLRHNYIHITTIVSSKHLYSVRQYEINRDKYLHSVNKHSEYSHPDLSPGQN